MKQIVYDAQGNSYTLDSVDAREYLATGRYFTDVPEQEAENPKRVIKSTKKTATTNGANS